MEEQTTQTPKPNEFAIPENQGYAFTHVRVGVAAEFLMTKLDSIKPEDLDPGNRVCTICHEELLDPNDTRLSHAPVKLVCGHVFGKNCIMRWLDPLGTLYYRREYDGSISVKFEHGKNSCPICRQVFFSECPSEGTRRALAKRLSFWDMAYTCAGIARSGKEETSRKYLLEYIDYYRMLGEDEEQKELDWEILKCGQEILLNAAICLKRQVLTPEQENLRKRLERIGRKDLDQCPFENGSFDFNIDSDNNERIEFQDQPME